VTRLDWIILAVVVGTALLGFWQGLTLSVLSAAGVVVGALLGARLAPHVLPAGSESPYTPLVALIGAAAGAIVMELIASSVGVAIKQRLRASPLRLVDTVGGLAFGIVIGLAVIWILAAVALQLPDRWSSGGTCSARRSSRAQRVPPRDVLNALRGGSVPVDTGRCLVDPPDPQVVRDPEIGQRCRASSACWDGVRPRSPVPAGSRPQRRIDRRT
jgi:hypothetical protein